MSLPRVVKPSPVQGVPPPEPARDERPVLAHFQPLALIAVLMFMAALTIAKVIFLPLAVAFLLSFIFRPLIRRLAAHGIPPVLSALGVIASLLIVMVVSIIYLAEPFQEWMVKLPQALYAIEGRLQALSSSFTPVAEVGRAVDDITGNTAHSVQRVEVMAGSWSTWLLSSVREAMVWWLIFIVALYFILACGDRFLRNLVGMIPGLGGELVRGDVVMGGWRGRSLSIDLLADIEGGISSYLVAITAINAGLGLCIALAMYGLGMPAPLLWGAMAFFLNYLPYVGPVVGLVLMALGSYATFADAPRAFQPPLIYAVFILVEGHFITPYLVGRRLLMNPIVIFIWLLIIGWMWGMVGAIIAMPLLMVIKIVSERIPGRRWISELIES